MNVTDESNVNKICTLKGNSTERRNEKEFILAYSNAKSNVCPFLTVNYAPPRGKLSG